MKEDRDRARGHRFFIDPAAIEGDALCLTGAQARQISRVLRLRAGEQIRVFHGSPAEFLVRLESVQADVVRGQILDQWQPRTECACRLWLAVPLLKAEKLEWVIQKSVELGACGIVLTRTHRTVVQPAEARLGARLERYRRIALEATEQCGRLQVPPIEGPFRWTQALERGRSLGTGFIAHEASTCTVSAALPDKRPLRSGILYTGPEGGLTDDEIREAQTAGVTPVSLGPRILRAETAALVGITLLLAEEGK
jgi:16S rRNA (uracil1498-N3)-methyltransferase